MGWSNHGKNSEKIMIALPYIALVLYIRCCVSSLNITFIACPTYHKLIQDTLAWRIKDIQCNQHASRLASANRYPGKSCISPHRHILFTSSLPVFHTGFLWGYPGVAGSLNPWGGVDWLLISWDGVKPFKATNSKVPPCAVA